MRRRIGTALVLIALATLAVGGVTTRISYAAEVRTFADDFSNRSYSASDGTHPWNGPWVEAPIHNGANRGNIQLTNSGSSCSDGCLSLSDPRLVVDSSIARSVDIDGASSARLDFRYRTNGESSELATVVLSVHDGARARTLWVFPLSDDDDRMLSASFDIGSYASTDTTIRFSIVGVGVENSELLVDDVVITASFGETSATTTTTTTVPGTVPSTVPPGPTTTTEPTVTTSTTTTTTTTTVPPTTTTTTRATTTTTTAPASDASDATTTTTSIVPPTEDPDYATDKAVLVSSNENAAMAVMQPMETMTPGNTPQSIRTVTFVNAAESVRSTAVYGVGVGLLLAGYLLVGFDDGEPRADRRRPGRRG